MTGPYEIVPYHERFKEQVIRLAGDLWTGSPDANRAYFAWKHERNPYTRSPLLYLALHREEVVGMRSFFGVCWEGGTPRQRLTGLYADDMMIAEAHRNQGLARRIMESAFEGLSALGYAYLFNLSAGPVTQLSSLSMGWRSAGSMQPMRRGAARPTRPQSRVAQRLSFLPAPLRGLASRARRLLEGAREDSNALTRDWNEVVQTTTMTFAPEPRIDAMAALFETVGDDRIRHVCDRRYLTWRLQNPQRRYGYLFFEGSALEGYLILQQSVVGHADQRLSIVDWQGTRSAVLGDLLDAACRIAGNRPLFVWSASLSSLQVTLLADRGFQAQSFEGQTFRQPALLVRALDDRLSPSDWVFAGRRLTEVANWQPCMLYSMHG